MMNQSENKRTRIKICGIRDPLALSAAIDAGADAVGLMFYEGSRRYIDVENARLLTQDMPAFVAKVAVLVNASVEFVEQVINSVRPDYLQFHGDESADFCRQFKVPYIRAFGMQESTDLKKMSTDFADARALLVDTYSQSDYGGVGKTFNWNWLLRQKPDCSLPIILAGGLNTKNVAVAIDKVRPFAVDVSSGVEDNGRKDSAKIQAFCRQVRGANIN